MSTMSACPPVSGTWSVTRVRLAAPGVVPAAASSWLTIGRSWWWSRLGELARRSGGPVGEQEGGVVLEDTLLVVENGVDDLTQGLRRRLGGGGLAFEEVDEPAGAEHGPARVGPR